MTEGEMMDKLDTARALMGEVFVGLGDEAEVSNVLLESKERLDAARMMVVHGLSREEAEAHILSIRIEGEPTPR